MRRNAVHIKTFGCQMNRLDSALVAASLEQAGFQLVDNEADSNVVLINTCSVRGHAEEKVYSHIGRLKHLKKDRPDLLVAVIGCMAQRLGKDLLDHDAVDIVCGPAQIPQITQLIENALSQKKTQLAVTDKIRSWQEQLSGQLDSFEALHNTPDRNTPCQACVRIMRGCNNFCSYCIVPYVRGPEISRPPQAIIEQIKRLADRGVKLVTLLGQRVNAYEYLAGEKSYCLADLLEMADKIDGIRWMRFVTSYPSEKFYDRILQAMRSLPKACPYLHMPAQSGSDRILKAMNRRYSAAMYLGLLDKARGTVPDLAVCGDFIVGFPGETEHDFEKSLELLQKAQYKNAFIFKYSPRPGTVGQEKFTDDVPSDVKKLRNQKLLDAQNAVALHLAGEFVGKTVTVLVEGLSKKPHLNPPDAAGRPQLVARTAADWIVVFNGPESLAGRFVDVKIEKTSPLTLFGRLLAP